MHLCTSGAVHLTGIFPPREMYDSLSNKSLDIPKSAIYTCIHTRSVVSKYKCNSIGIIVLISAIHLHYDYIATEFKI